MIKNVLVPVNMEEWMHFKSLLQLKEGATVASEMSEMLKKHKAENKHLASILTGKGVRKHDR